MIIASIDIGTNSVLMLIAEWDDKSKSFNNMNNFSRIVRLGKDLTFNKKISSVKLNELIFVLNNFKEIAENSDCGKILATGTSALRKAGNNIEVLKEVKDKTGIEIKIISGEEEAKRSLIGTIFGKTDSDEKVSIIDIGGGSTEIIAGNLNNISYSKSFDIGVVGLTEKFFKNDSPSGFEIDSLTNNITFILSELKNTHLDFSKCFALAGTPTTLVCIKMNLNVYDEDKIEGSKLKLSDVNKIINILSKFKSEEIIKFYPCVEIGREDLILSGAILLYQIMKLLKIEEVIVSSKGLRYGTAVKYLLEN